jgi:hypothetical protein
MFLQYLNITLYACGQDIANKIHVSEIIHFMTLKGNKNLNCFPTRFASATNKHDNQ